jgi:ABC-type antimicrobial peptide transport system permease subunit
LPNALPSVLPQLGRLWASALAAAIVTWAVRWPWLGADGVPRRLEAVVLLGVFAATYGLVTVAAGVPEAASLWQRVRRLRGGSASRGGS